MKCEICQSELNKNHLRIHGINRKDYYDVYIKSETEGKCLDCGKDTKYIDFDRGYNKRCLPCTNKRIGNDKRKKYADYIVEKKCVICDMPFKSDSRKNRIVCSRYKCRGHSPTDPKDIKTWSFIDRNTCPYCNATFDTPQGTIQHLRCHFPVSELSTVWEFVINDIWKLPKVKCKNPNCNNDAQKKNICEYGNFCKSCVESSEFSSNRAIKYLHTEDEIKTMICNRARAIQKSYDIRRSSETGMRQLELQWKENGKKISLALKKYYQTEEGKAQKIESAKKQSEAMICKINNGEFTPTITNSWTHWTAIIEMNGEYKKFRSTWDACFYVSNPTCEYETVRIPYIKENGKQSTTIVDFFDRKNNILYELKPRSVFITQKNKIDGVIDYCLKNDIKFIWINENNILNYVDKSKFSDYNLIQYNKLIQYVKPKN